MFFRREKPLAPVGIQTLDCPTCGLVTALTVLSWLQTLALQYSQLSGVMKLVTLLHYVWSVLGQQPSFLTYVCPVCLRTSVEMLVECLKLPYLLESRTRCFFLNLALKCVGSS
jgi:hypothetical protein